MDYIRRKKLGEADWDFVDQFWDQKLDHLDSDQDEVDITRIVDFEKAPWKQLLESAGGDRTYLQIAFDFENLFLYARKTMGRYHFFGDKYDVPMSKDVLECRTPAEVNKLKTQRPYSSDVVEIHEWSAKSRERDFFRTSQGFFGLGPATLEVGDHIVVPFGSSRPLILREISPNEHGLRYQLVGDAVIWAVMEGQWHKQRTAKYFDIV
ncbi:hypothetical protein BAUCODRAFT_76491 [Baudoinia panamericana UAMH 10762]|uniref:Heterokaryon incompatibility domain-containing protein n=1 Tax=Baudoinia panamericana (strain UAMH 10762) TaxID=717646 RepID=M2LHE4_BAUPA|nr:uncharacterized protein BAUCODRAFT_76491 [Baudoinia panamericana UAMH 10762]EMC93572.1 hypothetical protein BAUCODRAFT_76491 [Baudoinia panamericana UAMH 10762]